MLAEFTFFLVVLVVIAAITRDGFVFTLLYLLGGVYIIGRLLNNHAQKAVRFTRTFADRAFIGDDVRVELQIRNAGLLPVVWLRLQDYLPVELAVAGAFKQVISLGPHAETRLSYRLFTRKRGYYTIGPLATLAGDLFGASEEPKLSDALNPDSQATLIVYPRVYHLENFSLPSRSPMGTLPSIQPIFEDPTRLRGKRDYVAGDSLRRIDWKSTAALGRMQVRQFEPSIALETIICLNLNADEYDIHTRFDSTELGITVAASIANWVSSHKQPVGLVTNGRDPLTNGQFRPLPARKNQLMRILEMLARIEAAEGRSFVDLLEHEQVHFPWGATLALVTGASAISDELFESVFQVRRRGLSVSLILVGVGSGMQATRSRAENFRIPLIHIRSEAELAL